MPLTTRVEEVSLSLVACKKVMYSPAAVAPCPQHHSNNKRSRRALQSGQGDKSGTELVFRADRKPPYRLAGGCKRHLTYYWRGNWVKDGRLDHNVCIMSHVVAKARPRVENKPQRRAVCSQGAWDNSEVSAAFDLYARRGEVQKRWASYRFLKRFVAWQP